jgi:nucleoside 2-deoxyribosyltransferase
VIYLASPYTHADPDVREQRFQSACRKTADLLRNGRLVYSPIVHSHPLSLLGLPGDWPFWAAHNRAMLARSTSLLVLQLDGWEQSRGVAAEIGIAEALGIPVAFDPAWDTVP